MKIEASSGGDPALDRDASGRGRLSRALVPAIALVALLASVNTVPNGLVYDDLALIPHRDAIHDPLDLGRIVSSTYWGLDDDLYRPLTLWTLAVNRGVNRLLGYPGEHPTGYHLVNLLLHIGVSCCLYLWLRRLRVAEWPSATAALIFATHPLHTEAVALIVGRSELLAALFGLLFLMAHRRGLRAPVGAVCYFLALSSKESAVAFLPLALWGDACLPNARKPIRWGAVASYVLALGGWVALRAAVVPAESPGIPLVDNPLAYASVTERWLTAARVQFDYLCLQLFPFGLSADYSYDQIPVISGFRDARVLLFVLVVLAVSVLAWRARRAHPVFLFAVVGYAMLFALTSNFLFPIGTIMGERLAYAPSLLVCLLLGYGGWRLRARLGRVVTVAVAMVVLVFTALAVERNATYRDEGTHVRALVRSAPNNAKAHFHMARYLHEMGEAQGSIAASRRAIAILPTYAEAWNQLGLGFAATEDYAAAVEAHERATRIFPDYAEAWGNLGVACAERGDHAAAIKAFREALRLEPDRASTHYGLGLALHRLERLTEAADAYRTALSLDPDLAKACSNLGSILAGAGRFDEAAALWRRALEADPDHAVARENLERLMRLQAPD